MYKIEFVEDDNMSGFLDAFMNETKGNITKDEFDLLRTKFVQILSDYSWIEHSHYSIGNCFNNAPILWLDLFSKTMFDQNVFEAIQVLTKNLKMNWMVGIQTDDGSIMAGYNAKPILPIKDIFGDLLVSKECIYLNNSSDTEFLTILPPNKD